MNGVVRPAHSKCLELYKQKQSMYTFILCLRGKLYRDIFKLIYHHVKTLPKNRCKCCMRDLGRWWDVKCTEKQCRLRKKRRRKKKKRGWVQGNHYFFHDILIPPYLGFTSSVPKQRTPQEFAQYVHQLFYAKPDKRVYPPPQKPYIPKQRRKYGGDQVRCWK